MKKLIWFTMLLLMPNVGLGANDICVHLNGGDDVAYIGEYNTMEFWVANDIELKALQFTMEICWPSDTTLWVWDSTYGSDPPFNRHGDAVDNLILFASADAFDNTSCEEFAAGAAGFMPSQNLPTGSSRLLYSLQFGLLSHSEHADAIQVQPYAYFASNNWYFMRTDNSTFAPDFCGEPVSGIHDPTATPVTFSIVHRSQTACGDVNCDGTANITDAVYLIQYIFGGGPAPCDPDDDGVPDC
jgi:hypothetical protein